MIQNSDKRVHPAMNVTFHPDHDFRFGESPRQGRIARSLTMVPFTIDFRHGMNVVRHGIRIDDLQYLSGLNAKHPGTEPAATLIDGYRRGRDFKSFSFEAALDIDESIRQAALFAHHQGFVIRLAVMRLNTGRLLAHIDDLRYRPFPRETYPSADRPGGFRIHLEVDRRRRIFCWLFSLCFFRAAGKHRGSAAEKEKVNRFHIYLWPPRWPGVLRHLAGQRLKKCNQVRAVLGGQMERLHFLIEIGIGVAASDIEIDYILERFQAAIMHVGCGQSNVAQGWRLELPLIRFAFRLTKPANISEVASSIYPGSRIVEFSVGEQSIPGIDGVANSTIASFGVCKDLEAVDRCRGKRLLVSSILISIEGRITAEQRALKAG